MSPHARCYRWAAVAICWLAACEASAAAPAWLTGTDFQRRLAAPVGIAWTEAPLRQTLYALGARNRVAVLLDRRADPDAPVTLRLADAPLEQVFGKVAAARGLGATTIGSLVYVGPAEYVADLATLVEIQRAAVRDDPARRTIFARKLPLAWDDAAEPARLVAALAAEGALTLEGPRPPHDLWAAASLPPLALVDRLTLILGQYDTGFAWDKDERRLRLTRLAPGPRIVRAYAVPAARRPAAAELLGQWASAKALSAGPELQLSARVEDHRRFAEWLAGAARVPSMPRAGAAESPLELKRFTIRQARGTLEDLATRLAEQVGLELAWDREGLAKAGRRLDQPVAFSVREATVDGMLATLLEGTGCTFRREGRQVTIGPK